MIFCCCLIVGDESTFIYEPLELAIEVAKLLSADRGFLGVSVGR